jgi:hypothetical protein
VASFGIGIPRLINFVFFVRGSVHIHFTIAIWTIRSDEMLTPVVSRSKKLMAFDNFILLLNYCFYYFVDYSFNWFRIDFVGD